MLEHSQLLAFKPRQVLLSLKSTTSAAGMVKKEGEKLETLILRSVLGYLESNGYSKSLKYLLSNSPQIQDESWKTSSLNLEDVFRHYLETCTDGDAKLDSPKEKDLRTSGTNNDGADHDSVVEEALVKKKKKKSEKSDNVAAIADDQQVSEQATKEEKDKKKKSKKNSGSLESNAEQVQLGDNNVDTKQEVKCKDKKKKSKSSANSVAENVELFDSGDKKGSVEHILAEKVEQDTSSKANGEADPESEQHKDKKKKKKKQTSDSVEEETEKKQNSESADKKKKKKQNSDRVIEKEDKKIKKEESASQLLCNGVTEIPNEEGTTQNKLQKDSKKRKRSDFDENDSGTPHLMGDHEKNGEESTRNKSARKESNGSAEPKTVNAFQRVKIDEVKFADERLQDNSYWAKSGAEVGYGAKAQEVLGQVKGRDFRHEKTKKKRGSYRGGLIDLHSHSVKFNYSDED